VTGGHPKVWMVGVDGGMGEIPGPFMATRNTNVLGPYLLCTLHSQRDAWVRHCGFERVPRLPK
jgi:hypothetical protein